MSLRSLAAGFILAILLVVSLGGAVCDASCASATEQGHDCCPPSHGIKLGGDHSAIGSPAGCAHRPQEQAGVLTAPVFITHTPMVEAPAAPALFLAASGPRTVIAAASPPVFPLRI